MTNKSPKTVSDLSSESFGRVPRVHWDHFKWIPYFQGHLDDLYDCQQERDKECKRLGSLLKGFGQSYRCNRETHTRLRQTLTELSEFFRFLEGPSEINSNAFYLAVESAQGQAERLSAKIRELRNQIRAQAPTNIRRQNRS